MGLEQKRFTEAASISLSPDPGQLALFPMDVNRGPYNSFGCKVLPSTVLTYSSVRDINIPVNVSLACNSVYSTCQVVIVPLAINSPGIDLGRNNNCGHLPKSPMPIGPAVP